LEGQPEIKPVVGDELVGEPVTQLVVKDEPVGEPVTQLVGGVEKEKEKTLKEEEVKVLILPPPATQVELPVELKVEETEARVPAADSGLPLRLKKTVTKQVMDVLLGGWTRVLQNRRFVARAREEGRTGRVWGWCRGRR